MAKRKNIPVFDQHKQAKAGFFIKSMNRQSLDETEHDIVSAHRDEAYMLFVLKAGFAGPSLILKNALLWVLRSA